MSKIQKYRPYLSAAQISYLVSLAESDNREATASLRNSCIRDLKMFQLKSQIGLVNPAAVTSVKESIEDSLGLGLSPTEQREQAYQLYILNPSMCSMAQVRQAKTYMYENGLMTSEEEERYECMDAGIS